MIDRGDYQGNSQELFEASCPTTKEIKQSTDIALPKVKETNKSFQNLESYVPTPTAQSSSLFQTCSGRTLKISRESLLSASRLLSSDSSNCKSHQKQVKMSDRSFV